MTVAPNTRNSFIARLSDIADHVHHESSLKRFRIIVSCQPTEAEWEYASRAGTTNAPILDRAKSMAKTIPKRW